LDKFTITSSDRPWLRVLVFGSPHGDDQVAWELVERLRQKQVPGIAAAALHDPMCLLHHLGDCAAVVLVDACHSWAEPGTIVRMVWPGSGREDFRGTSTHGVGVADALALAEALGRLPPCVLLFRVEIHSCDLGAEISAAVRRAMPGLYQRVLAAIDRQQQEGADGAEGTIGGRATTRPA
jgi:hydrogenase maturation protease